MGKMESFEKIFKKFNGDKIAYSPNYVQQLELLSEEIICQKKVKEICFRSRMYFRIKADFTYYAASAPRYYDPHFLIKHILTQTAKFEYFVNWIKKHLKIFVWVNIYLIKKCGS